MKSLFLTFILLFILSCDQQQNLQAQNAQQLETISTNVADSILIKKHLNAIVNTKKSRSYKNVETLNHVASYIFKTFNKYADTTYYQKFNVNGNEYKNVVSVFGAHNKKTIVVGAHYDVCGDQKGADDNASGTTGLLELARLLKGHKLNYRIELVAFTLEEPPFFRTKEMGSYIHAKSLKDNNTDLYGMVCLEMIGYFDHREDSQNYPVASLSKIYGNKADFIALVNKMEAGNFAKTFSGNFKKENLIKTEQITAPASMEGIDFSDHLNYWNFGYSAVMITDTSFFRNHNYHEETDTIETLNIPKMKNVITTVYKTLTSLE